MYVSRCKILNDVIKALEGSSPSYSFSNIDGLYVATGFVVVPLAGDIDELTLLEATGSASLTKDGAEEAAANALILAAKRDFGVVVDDFSFNDAKHLRKENESLHKNNLLLKSGWVQSIDQLDMVRKTLEQITMDAVGGLSRTSIGLLAYGAAGWAEENVWSATAALEESCSDSMDEN